MSETKWTALRNKMKDQIEETHDVSLTIEDILIEDPVERILNFLDTADKEVTYSHALLLFLAAASDGQRDEFLKQNADDPDFQKWLYEGPKIKDEIGGRLKDQPSKMRLRDIIPKTELASIIEKHSTVASLIYDEPKLSLEQAMQEHIEGWLSGRSVVSREDLREVPVLRQFEEKAAADPSWTEELRAKLLMDCFMKALNVCGFREFHPFDPDHPKWKRDL